MALTDVGTNTQDLQINQMTILDCHTFDSTLASLAAIINVEPEVLTQKLKAFSEDDWPDHPPDHLWNEIVGKSKPFDGVYWFHLSRTLSPETFRSSGILPLDEVFEMLWEVIFSLIGERQSLTEKHEFRRRLYNGNDDSHSAFLFRLKVNSPLNWGPFGMLVRDAAFKSSELRSHHYLSAPEIVEDICQFHSECYGGSLLTEFQNRAVSCIVKFRGDNNRPDALSAALMYLWAKVHDEPLSLNCNTCFDGRGTAVEPGRIIEIEIDPVIDPGMLRGTGLK